MGKTHSCSSLGRAWTHVRAQKFGPGPFLQRYELEQALPRPAQWTGRALAKLELLVPSDGMTFGEEIEFRLKNELD